METTLFSKSKGLSFLKRDYSGMAMAFYHSPPNIPFKDRLGLLVDVEYTSRKNNRLHRLIKNAVFDQPQANIADINYQSLEGNLINL